MSSAHLWDVLLEGRDDLPGVETGAERTQFGEQRMCRVIGQGFCAVARPCADARVGGWAEHLGGVGELFVDLRAGPGAGEGDLDRRAAGRRGGGQAGGQPVCAGEALGELDNPNRFTHVEHVHARTLPGRGVERCRLQHQRRGLVDGHEVAGHPLIGHGDWSALGELARPDGQHAARRAKHVAKPDHAHAGRCGCLRGEPGHVDLREPFGRAHHAGWVHRLIRGDHHESLGPARGGGIGDGLGAEQVVGQCVRRVILHERHVLVRGGVEDRVRAQLIQKPLRSRRVDNIVQDGAARNAGESLGDLPIDFEQSILAAFHQHELRRGKARAQARKLGADAAAGAGDQDALAGEDAAHRVAIQAVRFAADEPGHVDRGCRGEHGGVGGLDVPRFVVLGRGCGDGLSEQVAQRGDGAFGDSGEPEQFAGADRRGTKVGRKANQREPGPVLCGDGGEVLGGAEIWSRERGAVSRSHAGRKNAAGDHWRIGREGDLRGKLLDRLGCADEQDSGSDSSSVGIARSERSGGVHLQDTSAGGPAKRGSLRGLERGQRVRRHDGSERAWGPVNNAYSSAIRGTVAEWWGLGAAALDPAVWSVFARIRMRIISGEFRRRQLISPKDASTTRPIPDRVKESVFSILRGHFEGARVLDAFAGSGSIGLEALSRGASFVLFVERDKAAATLLEQNIELLGCGDRCEVLRADAIGPATFARCPRPLDLAFFDPPYPLVEDPASWDRIRGQVGRVADLLTQVGFVALRTPWPFRQALPDPAATPENLREDRKLKDRKERLGRKLREQEWVLDEIDAEEIEAETLEDEAEIEEIEGVEAAAALEQRFGDLNIEGAAGPETHVYGSTAVHLYMRRPPAAE